MARKLGQIQRQQAGIALMVISIIIIATLAVLSLLQTSVFSRDTEGWAVTGLVFSWLLGKLLDHKHPKQPLFQIRSRR